MSCSMSGSMPSRSPAWSDAPSRSSWSIVARNSVATGRRVRFQRALTARLVIDDRMRIGLAEFDAGTDEFERRCLPWLVDQIVRQLRQLRHPAPYVVAVRIELLALQDRIEHAKIWRGIGAGAGDPLPVGGIAAGVGIDQRIPKPLFTVAPVDQEMLDQERSDDHAHAIMHHACM